MPPKPEAEAASSDGTRPKTVLEGLMIEYEIKGKVPSVAPLQPAPQPKPQPKSTALVPAPPKSVPTSTALVPAPPQPKATALIKAKPPPVAKSTAPTSHAAVPALASFGTSIL